MTVDSQYLDDCENVKAMRDTARAIGLTQLLLEMHGLGWNAAGGQRLRQALALLGVEVKE